MARSRTLGQHRRKRRSRTSPCRRSCGSRWPGRKPSLCR